MRAAIPALRRAGGGSIINVASFYGPGGAPGYMPTRPASPMIAMSKVAALERAHHRVRANAILSRTVRSAISEQEGDASVDVTPLRRRAEPSPQPSPSSPPTTPST
jgi:NAD(P)-dependent dehydrogenase (short-subunit alcohol dehydrogenase family)